MPGTEKGRNEKRAVNVVYSERLFLDKQVDLW